MRIKEISRKKTFGHFENIGMVGEVEQGESYIDALKQLEVAIDIEIANRNHIVETHSDIVTLRHKKQELSTEIEIMEGKRNKLQAWAKKHGVIDNTFSDLPF